MTALQKVARFVSQNRKAAIRYAAHHLHEMRRLRALADDYRDQMLAAYRANEKAAGDLWAVLTHTVDREQSEAFKNYDLLFTALLRLPR